MHGQVSVVVEIHYGLAFAVDRSLTQKARSHVTANATDHARLVVVHVLFVDADVQQLA